MKCQQNPIISVTIHHSMMLLLLLLLRPNRPVPTPSILIQHVLNFLHPPTHSPSYLTIQLSSAINLKPQDWLL